MDVIYHAVTLNIACEEYITYITNFESLSSVGCAFKCLTDKVTALTNLDIAYM
jgi:hypothetical protein